MNSKQNEFTTIIFLGILWPLESIPEGLRYISMCLPTTFGSEAMRAILIKGMSIIEELL